MQSYDYSFITTIPKCYEFDFNVNNIDLSTTLYLDMVIGDLRFLSIALFTYLQYLCRRKRNGKVTKIAIPVFLRLDDMQDTYTKRLTLRRDRKLKDTFPWRIPGKCSLSI